MSTHPNPALPAPRAADWLPAALLSLLAFAANSLFCRMALIHGDIDPQSFTAVRLASGAAFLWVLLRVRQRPAAGSWAGALALFFYAWLFSVAYVRLGAGAGALVLFGAVQLTMFVASVVRGEGLQPRVLLGMLLAFAGLIALLLPGADTPPLFSALIMVLAGVAWGAYCLVGKGSADPLADTAGNFLRSLPLLVLVLLVPVALMSDAPVHASASGLWLAVGSGVLASGAGYALWYGVVRRISAQQAATMQLAVPVIAALGGVLLLGEALSLRLALTSLVVLGGVALALAPARRLRGTDSSR